MWRSARARLTSLRAADVLLLGGFALLVLAVLPPGSVSADGESMLAMTRSLATHGSLAIPCSSGGIVGRGGHCYSTFYPLQSFLAVPLFAVGDGIGHLAHVSATFVGNAMAQVLPALSAAVAATLTVKFARQFGASPLQAVLAGLTLVFATELAVYERTFFADALLTALIALQVWLLYRSTLSDWPIVLVLALTITAKPQAFIVGPLLALEVGRRSRSWRPVMLAAAGTAIGAVLYGIYDEIRFSSLTDLGGPLRTLQVSAYAPLHVIKQLGLLTISPGRGLLVFSPICILGLVVCVRRRHEPLARAAFIIVIGLLIIYVTAPTGGNSWASRYLTPAIPLLVAAAWSTRGGTRAAAAVLSLVGAVIQFPTFVGFYQRYYIEGDNHHIYPSQRYWSVLHSPLVGVWGSMVREVNDAATTNLHLLVGAKVAGSTVEDQRFFHVISEWWWMLPLAHVPWPVGALVAFGLAAAGLLLLRAWLHPEGARSGGGDRGGRDPDGPRGEERDVVVPTGVAEAAA